MMCWRECPCIRQPNAPKVLDGKSRTFPKFLVASQFLFRCAMQSKGTRLVQAFCCGPGRFHKPLLRSVPGSGPINHEHHHPALWINLIN